MRTRAIFCALWFGVLPWWVYERECHYRPIGYWRHLLQNLGYAWRWMRKREDAADRAFEAAANVRPNWVRWLNRPPATQQEPERKETP
jgi:hypothetical protein